MRTTLSDATTGDFLRWARSTPAAAFDIETTGLDIDTDRIRFATMGDEHQAWVITPGFIDVFAMALRITPKPLAHNGLFDARWLQHHWGIDMGPVVRRMTDTFLMASLYNPRRPWGTEDDEDYSAGRGLKELANELIEPDADRYERALHAKFTLPANSALKAYREIWASIPDDDPAMLDYGAYDVILTTRLYYWYTQHLDDHERTELLDIERRVAHTAFGITMRGIDADVDRARQIRDDLIAEAEKYDELLRPYGVLNANSSKQSVAALLEAGVPLTKRTDTGSLSSDSKVLDYFAAQGFELAGLIRQARQARRFANTYAAKVVGSGGCIHPVVGSFGAVTGRWTVSSPPLQQWPKPGRYPVDMRSMFHAPEGKVLVSEDLSSIEFVVAAAVTQDPAMLKAVAPEAGPKIRAYDDLQAALGLPTRDLAKSVVLAGQYLAGAEKMSAMIGRPIQETKVLKARTFGGWACEDEDCPEPNPWKDCEDHRVYIEGFYTGPRAFYKRLQSDWRSGWTGETRDGWPGVRNAYGRWVPAAQEKNGAPTFYPTFNHVVQGSSRDLLMRMVLELEDRGYTVWLTVHDEIALVVDEGEADKASRVLHEVMTSDMHEVFGVPIRAEADKRGPRKEW